MKTKDEFIAKWRRHMAGMAMFGTISDMRDGPLTRAGKLLEIPAEVEKLLGQLYDDLNPAPKPPTNGNTNGQAPQPQKARTP